MLNYVVDIEKQVEFITDNEKFWIYVSNFQRQLCNFEALFPLF